MTPSRPSFLRLSVAPAVALIAAGLVGASGLVLPLPDGAERAAAWLVPGASDAARALDERAERREAPRTRPPVGARHTAPPAREAGRP